MVTTMLRRLVLPGFIFLAWTPVAHAWSWPVQGPVLEPFSYDEAHPYASGQHRGIDIGAEAAGESVLAPATGTVSFAGTVPTNGKSVTIETPDGYSVTLTHLGSTAVAKGAAVTEGDAVGTIGPSGTPEVAGPYVHLGIRLTTDPNGYLDPLSLLPPLPEGEPARSVPPTSHPLASRGATRRLVTTRASANRRSTTRGPRVTSRPRPSLQRPAVQADARTSAHTTRTPRRLPEPSHSTSRRPILEPAPARPAARVTRLKPPEREAPLLLPLLCNGAAALVALFAALAAGRRRRPASVRGGATILHLPRAAHLRRAA
jgi:Peptidase family M23